MSVYAFGSFQLDDERLLLLHEGVPVSLGPKVVQTLLALVEHPGDVLTKAALIDRIWPEGFVEEANLAQNIHVLRKTFARFGSRNPIKTVPCRGYRLTETVRLVASLPDSLPVEASRVAPRASEEVPRRWLGAGAALACAVLVAASIMLASSGQGRRDARYDLSPNGTRLYGIGRYYWNLRTREGVRTSLTYFARVVDADPQDPRGYAALADANVAMGDYCYGTHRPSVYFARAREYANRALALDPRSAEAHASLGFFLLHSRKARLAAEELQRAIALNPSYAPAHEWYGIALVGSRRLSDGLRQLRIAADLDPLSVATFAWLGSGALKEGRFADAVAYSRQALELVPQRLDALTTIGESYEAQGDVDGAIRAFRQYEAIGLYYRPQAAAFLARAYALAHRPSLAREELAYAKAHADQVHAEDLAAAAAAVEGRGAGLNMLRQPRGHPASAAIEDAAHFEV